MPTTLYRKYRPQSFADLVNQNHVKITLRNEIETDSMAQAYLFSGPRGIGKTTTARIFAKAVNCQKRKEKQSEPCNNCDFCREITEGKSLDIIEIDAASHTGVDNVRENVIENARVAPSRLKYKVFIIDEAHMLSISAFNALLKTLEEPPSRVIFILATTEVHKIPTTIISRTERFDFKKINSEDLVKRLKFLAAEEGVAVAASTLKAIARGSEGALRDAESMLGQVLSLASHQGKKRSVSEEEAELVIPKSMFLSVGEFIGYLINKQAAEAVTLINRLLNEGVELKQFYNEVIEMLRQALLLKLNSNSLVFSLNLDGQTETFLKNAVNKSELSDILTIIDLFLKRNSDIKNASFMQLPLEIAAIEACERSSGGAPVEIKSYYKEKEKEARPNKKAARPRLSTEKEKEKKSSSKITNKKTNINLEKMLEHWQKVMDKIGEYNHSLPLAMKTCRPTALSGGVLEIKFQYKLHQEKIDEPANKKVIENILKDVFREDLKIKPILGSPEDFIEVSKQLSGADEENVVEGKSGKPEAEEEILRNVLEEFGGKVVE